MGKLHVAMIAPPWIRLPPLGYGGIEASLHCLIEQLVERGHTVEVFTVGNSAVSGATVHSLFPTGQYQHIFDPLYEVAAVPLAHILMARGVIRKRDFDLVHDHNYLFGPAILSQLGPARPPVLHTLHGPFFGPSATGPASNLEVYTELAGDEHLWFNGISHAQLRSAPPALRPRLVGVVYNALDLRQYPVSTGPRDAFLTLARFAPEKGHATAARLCRASGAKLRMAGAIGTITSPDELAAVLADPTSPHWRNRELQHFRDDVQAHLVPGLIEYVGEAFGTAKVELLQRSKALLFPVQWDEPFGVAAVEAMACGTPVVAFARGALPELIEHGVNGFLAETEAEFVELMNRVGEIDPLRCRAVVEERFSATRMACDYEAAYQDILRRRNATYA